MCMPILKNIFHTYLFVGNVLAFYLIQRKLSYKLKKTDMRNVMYAI